MHRRTRTTGTAAVAAALVALTAWTAPAAHAATSTVRVVVGGALPGLGAATPVGDTEPRRTVSVDLTLARPDRAGEAALEHDLSTPGSPLFHQFLTPDAYAARFGVPAATEAAAVAFATGHGLRLESTSSTGDVLSLRGTVAAAEATFGVDIRDFEVQGTRFYANTSAPTAPAGLGAIGVIGLNDALRSRTFTTSPSAGTSQDTCVGGRCTGLTTPQDLWSIYDQPDSDMGQGQTMAIFGEGQTDDVVSDLRSFEALHGLRRAPISVVRADGPDADYSDDSGLVEWDLDTQSSTGMAPLVKEERLYFGEDLTDASTLNVLKAWVKDPTGPKQASASYGECEENPTSPAPAPGTSLGGLAGSANATYTQAYEAQLQQAVNQGQTLFASTGDTGSSCPVVVATVIGAGNGILNQGFPVANYPASSPHVVAVGGTVLYGTPATSTDATRADGATRSLEYAWTFTGGGPSQVFPKPGYQEGITPATTLCVIKPDGSPAAPGTICRGTPDIAAQSGDVATNGYAIYSGGSGTFPGGGTSLSSPLSLGMWTRVQAASASAAGRGLGFASSTYYGLAADPAKDVRDFFDVGGPAQSEPSGNGAFTSLPRSSANPQGWDFVSGLGVPDVLHVIQDLAGSTSAFPAPADPSLPPEPPAPGVGGGTADPACGPVFTDPAGDDAFIGDPAGGGSNPQLDLVQGDVHTIVRGGATYLQTILTIKDLSTEQASAAGAGNVYYTTWSILNGGTYFTSAEVDAGSTTPIYGHGTVSGTRYTRSSDTAATGSFVTGPNGKVTVEIPLTGPNVGAVAPGATLKSVGATTKVLVGTGTTGGSLQQADDATGRDYVLGEICAATGRQGSSGGDVAGPTAAVPEAPRPVLLVVGAGVVGFAVVARRRRRRPAA